MFKRKPDIDTLTHEVAIEALLTVGTLIVRNLPEGVLGYLVLVRKSDGASAVSANVPKPLALKILKNLSVTMEREVQ